MLTEALWTLSTLLSKVSYVNSGKMWSVVFTLKTKIRNDSVFLKNENDILTFQNVQSENFPIIDHFPL